MRLRNGKYADTKEAYKKLYDCVTKNDDHIAWVYNDKGGSRWIEIMADQLTDGVITVDDLRDFDEVVRKAIMMMSRII